MFLEIFVAVGGYYAYKGLKSGRTKTAPSRTHPAAPDPDAIGAAGEAAAQAKLRETLYWLCGNQFYLHDGPLILEHAPGTDFPTAEIDHLAVTPFGIFVFEAKNWSGHIAPSPVPGMLRRTAPNGQSEDRRSPIEQNRTKISFLRSRLPPMWPVMGAGLFASPEARLDPGLSIDLLSLADLPQWLRTRREQYGAHKPVDVAKATAAARMYSDSSKSAIADHLLRVRQ
ncbi:nuclease-like protein [Paraburkholderia sp. BL8N3]|nr:nuclease-related domain-containing protein [Paraburkholderia sp. BL8N3]TCK32494.1 nuclease-like protein [Paraburkholderia sp. BL8N3]